VRDGDDCTRKVELEKRGSIDTYYDALSCSGHDDRNLTLVSIWNGCQALCNSPSDDIKIDVSIPSLQ